MQHIPTVDGWNFSLKIPYYDSEHEYYRTGQRFGSSSDEAGWESWPGRAGYSWLRNGLTVQEMNVHYQQCDPIEFQAFAQAWMFFGILHEYLGQNYHKADFITQPDQHGTCYVTTEIWKHWATKKGTTSPPPSAWQPAQSRPSPYLRPGHCSGLIFKALTWSVLWDRFAIDKGDSWAGLSLSFKTTLEILAAFTCSPKAKGSTETRLSTEVHPGAALNLVRTLQLNDRKMWCSHQVDRLCSTLSYTALIYAATVAYSSRAHREGVNHTRCAKHPVCKAYDIDIGVDAKPVHTQEGCNCQHVEAPRDERVRILALGGIPVVSCVRVDGEFTLHFKPAFPEMDYTAISHLWADGLGNVFGNSLPRCQLSRLYDATFSANKALNVPGFGGKHRPTLERKEIGTPEVLFWLDVYCIPAQVPSSFDSGGVDPELEKQRKQNLYLKRKAISRMDATYAWAHHIIVLDRELARTVTSDARYVFKKDAISSVHAASTRTITSIAIYP